MNIPSIFLKNSSGKADGMWTLTVLSFILMYVGAFWFPQSATVVLSAFSACVAGYYGRKRTDAAAPPAPPISPGQIRAMEQARANIAAAARAGSTARKPPALSPEERDGGLIG